MATNQTPFHVNFAEPGIGKIPVPAKRRIVIEFISALGDFSLGRIRATMGGYAGKPAQSFEFWFPAVALIGPHESSQGFATAVKIYAESGEVIVDCPQGIPKQVTVAGYLEPL